MECRKRTDIAVSRGVLVHRFVALEVGEASFFYGGFDRGLIEFLTGTAPRRRKVDEKSLVIGGLGVFRPPHGFELFLRQSLRQR